MEITPSDSFKKMATKAIFSIVSFVLIYLILLCFGIALTALCITGGVALIVAVPKFITILLGIGLAGLGIIIIVFLFKFLFKKHKVDRSNLEEITRTDQPRLFSLIDNIVEETKTSFPKKVYISEEINASVFYDSSFWSMFLPIRKNLHIGMGLVNTVTEQELKAILAHEFGHFSQRSMSVGSYVYYVNEVIFNMLYDNDSFDRGIQAWANISGYFAIFVLIGVKIIQFIQWILRKMYSYVNLSYLALSREMEFHADEVAAHVAGSKALQDSLMRLDLAQEAQQEVFRFYNRKIEENYKSKNIFNDQLCVLNLLAKKNRIQIKNGLPYVTELEANMNAKSKLNIEDQWSSHPTVAERVVALEKLNIAKENRNENPAIELFDDPQSIENKFTSRLFSGVSYSADIIIVDSEKFEEEYVNFDDKYSFPEEYNGYYDNKNPVIFDLNQIIDFESSDTLETLFGNDKIALVAESIRLENDEKTLQSIVDKEVSVKTFDYDGQKYRSKDAINIIEQIKVEKETLKADIMANDMDIYKFFYSQAKKKGQETDLKKAYAEFFNQDRLFDSRFTLHREFIAATNFLRTTIDQDQIESYFKELNKVEERVKIEMRSILSAPRLEEEITSTIKKHFDKYLSQDWLYTANEEADGEYLETLFNAYDGYEFLMSRSYFLEKLYLLNYQMTLLIE